MPHDQSELTFLGVNLWSWILGTVSRVGRDTSPGAWSRAWITTYKELGGRSLSSGEKVCPMKGVYALYYLGRLEGVGRPVLDLPLSQVRSELLKNGTYAVIALNVLRENPRIGLHELWVHVRARYQQELLERPAVTEQGAVRAAHMLFRAGKIRY